MSSRDAKSTWLHQEAAQDKEQEEAAVKIQALALSGWSRRCPRGKLQKFFAALVELPAFQAQLLHSRTHDATVLDALP